MKVNMKWMDGSVKLAMVTVVAIVSAKPKAPISAGRRRRRFIISPTVSGPVFLLEALLQKLYMSRGGNNSKR